MTYYYKISKGTEILIHRADARFDLKKDWYWHITEKNISYTDDDVWFAPVYTFATRMEPKVLSIDNDEDTFTFVKNNMYGFILPKNSRNIDFILVPISSIKIQSSKIKIAVTGSDVELSSTQLVSRIKEKLSLGVQGKWAI